MPGPLTAPPGMAAPDHGVAHAEHGPGLPAWLPGEAATGAERMPGPENSSETVPGLLPGANGPRPVLPPGLAGSAIRMPLPKRGGLHRVPAP